MGAFKKMSGLRKGAEGSAAAELAVVLPFLVALVAGAVEYSTAFALQVDLEQAAQRAAELALSRPPTTNDAAGLGHIIDEAENASGHSDGADEITVTLYRNCVAADGTFTSPTTYPTNCATGQRAADYVSVEIDGTYNRLIDFRALMGEDSEATRVVTGRADVRVR